MRGGGIADARIAAVALLAAHTGASMCRRMPLFEAVAERDRQPLGLVARDAMVSFESGQNAIRARQDTEQCAWRHGGARPPGGPPHRAASRRAPPSRHRAPPVQLRCATVKQTATRQIPTVCEAIEAACWPGTTGPSARSEPTLAPSDPAVRGFLRRSMVVQVATLSPEGRPFVTPLWFVVEGGALYLTTGPATRAGRNVAQHPDVVLLFHGERSMQQGGLLRPGGARPATAGCHPGAYCCAWRRSIIYRPARYRWNCETPGSGVFAGDTTDRRRADSATFGSSRPAASSWHRRSSRRADVRCEIRAIARSASGTTPQTAAHALAAVMAAAAASSVNASTIIRWNSSTSGITVSSASMPMKRRSR